MSTVMTIDQEVGLCQASTVRNFRTVEISTKLKPVLEAENNVQILHISSTSFLVKHLGETHQQLKKKK